jgi:hypothetical protein
MTGKGNFRFPPGLVRDEGGHRSSVIQQSGSEQPLRVALRQIDYDSDALSSFSDGGTSAGCDPNSRLGSLPISKTICPPFTISR